MSKKTYSLDFKRRAVARLSNGQNAKDIAKKLKIMPSMLYAWRKKLAKLEKTKVVKAAKVPSAHDAIVYLRHARDAAVVQVTQDPTRFDDPVYQLAMMALRTLEGK